MRRRTTATLSLLTAALGVVLIVRTATVAGDAGLAFGYLFGAALLLAGLLRLYVSTR